MTRRDFLSSPRSFSPPQEGGVQPAYIVPSGGVGIAGADDPWQNWSSPTNRLVRRITMGITAVDAARAARLGYQPYLEEQLNPAAIDDTFCETVVATKWPRTQWTVSNLYGANDFWITNDQLIQSTVFRNAYSKRQLLEKVVEFWCDHFSVYSDKAGSAMMSHVRDAIRANALGNFRTLLRAVVGSPGMLWYLDNVYNYGDNPNINFAREILELHTVSPAAGYVTQDIKNLAKVLTGWTVDEGFTSLARRGQLRFDPGMHARGDKVVLGYRIPFSGQQEGELAISFLASHPKTAEHIAKKLVRFFVSHDPSPGLVNQVAQVFLATNGDIKSCLRAVLAQSVISTAPPKLKRPYNLAVSAFRGMRTKLTYMEYFRWITLNDLGQVPFQWEPPDGYPDRVDFWAASMRPRLQFAYSLANGEVWGLQSYDGRTWDSMTAADALARINKTLFGGEMSNRDRTSVETYLTAGPFDEWRYRGAHAIALASPSFQWY